MTKKPFTSKQGQYLAFIFYYTKIHGFAPAESDMQKYFKVSPPSVHQMVLTLEANGFIERVPGRGSLDSSADLSGGTARFGIGLSVHVQQPAELLSSRWLLTRDISSKLILIEHLPDGSKKSR